MSSCHGGADLEVVNDNAQITSQLAGTSPGCPGIDQACPWVLPSAYACPLFWPGKRTVRLMTGGRGGPPEVGNGYRGGSSPAHGRAEAHGHWKCSFLWHYFGKTALVSYENSQNCFTTGPFPSPDFVFRECRRFASSSFSLTFGFGGIFWSTPPSCFSKPSWRVMMRPSRHRGAVCVLRFYR